MSGAVPEPGVPGPASAAASPEPAPQPAPGSAAPAPDRDVFDPRRYARGLPHEVFRALRDGEPVAWQPEYEVLGWPAGPGFWAVTRHADVLRVLRSPGDFSSYEGATQIRDPAPEDLPFIRRMMLNQDPPAHNRLRTLVSRAFTRRRVERFEAQVRQRARRLLTGARGRRGSGGAAIWSPPSPTTSRC